MTSYWEQRGWWDTEPAAEAPAVGVVDMEAVGTEHPTQKPAADGEPWEPGDYTPAPIISFVTDVCGMTPYSAQAALLSELYNDSIRTAILRLGRRSGKDRMASWVAVYEATANADAHRSHVPPGELVGVAIVANSQRQARIILRWCREYLKRDGLDHLVVRDTGDELELSNGMVIVAMPCTARSTRGHAIAVVVFDEAAWFVDVDGSPMSGDELWQALVPATAQFPDGRVLILSTPRWSSGWFADMCRTAISGEFADMRHWWATTRTMNPQISDEWLDGERRKDEPSYLREYEARFDSGVGSALDGEAILAAVRKGLPSLPPAAGVAYAVSIDPAVSGDTWSLLVGHRDGAGDDARLMVDMAKGWTGRKGAPLDVRAVLDEVATVSKLYGHAPVVLDQFGQEFVAQGISERGLSPVRRPWTNESKAEALTTARIYANTGRLSLPDHGPLIGELRSLEQTVLPSGRPRIAAPSGQRDDYATAFLALAGYLHSGASYTGPVSFIA
jgi:hypothetical protein